MLEQKLIEHCSPTLASLKTGSLFNMNRVSQERLRAELEQLNHTLGPKGISLAVLSASPQCTLIYVYRKSRLERDLNNPAAASFLNALGYECSDADGAIERLRERLALLFAFFGFWSGKMNNQEPRFANQLNIQWFPGHMTKTLRMMEQEI